MNWPTVQITEVARVVGGATPKSKVEAYWGGAVHWATPKDLSDLQSQYISETPRTITEAGLKSCAAEVMPEGAVLFSSRAPIGHIAITKRPMATNQGFKSFVTGPKLDAGFLYWWLDANRERLQALGTGATFKEVSKATVQRIEIPLPPLEEQKRIAGILDQAAELCRLRTRALDKLNTLGQAVFHEMFGDVANNSMGLQKSTIGELCRRVSVGVVIKPASYYEDHGVPAIRGTNIKETGIDLTDLVYFSPEASDGPLRKSKVSTGDVLAVRSGRPGLAAIVPPELDGANCIDVLIASPDDKKLRPQYLRDFLNSDDGRRLVFSGSVGQVQKHFNVKALSSAEIPLPSLERQQVYVDRIASCDERRQGLISALAKQQTLFASLQHRAFRGEL